MSARQRHLFEWLSASATVIPVTARSESAFRRVRLPFGHGAILDFGGVVLLPDGRLDEEWDQKIRPVVMPLGDDLARIQSARQATSDARSLGARVRIIKLTEISFVVCATLPLRQISQPCKIKSAHFRLRSFRDSLLAA